MQRIDLFHVVAIAGTIAWAACGAQPESTDESGRNDSNLGQKTPSLEALSLLVDQYDRVVIGGDAPPDWLRPVIASGRCDDLDGIVDYDLNVQSETRKRPANTVYEPPISDDFLSEFLCFRPESQLRFDWANKRISGTILMFNRRHVPRVDALFRTLVDAGWEDRTKRSVHEAESATENGTLIIEPFDSDSNHSWTLEPVMWGEKLPGPVDPGVEIRLAPGIYKTPTGEHLAIKEGLLTRFMPGNPAALAIAGRRFPLDSRVEVRIDRTLPLAPNGDPLAVLASCEALGEARMPRCEPRTDHDRYHIWPDEVKESYHAVKRIVLTNDNRVDIEDALRANAKAGISHHLAIDFDGTIIQSVDLNLAAYHRPGPIHKSLAIVLNNLAPDLLAHPGAPAFPKNHPRAKEMAEHPRPTSPVRRINDKVVQTYGYTAAQMRSLASVARLLVRLYIFGRVGSPLLRDGTLELDFRHDDWKNDGFVGGSNLAADDVSPGPGFDWEAFIASLTLPERPASSAH